MLEHNWNHPLLMLSWTLILVEVSNQGKGLEMRSKWRRVWDEVKKCNMKTKFYRPTAAFAGMI
mgnify:FL=1